MIRISLKHCYLSFLRSVLLVLVFVFALAGISFDVCFGAEDKQITVPFPDFTQKKVFTWDFPYSDSYFLEPSDEFSLELAKATMGLTVSAFRNDASSLENQYATYLGGAGFSDIYAFGYDKETSKDTLSGAIAHKKIGDFTLIAAIPCGQGYKKEWAGNLEVGDSERHEGFNHAAGILEEQIRSYIETYHLEGPLKLWLGGFSRASAVANLTAADMIDSGLFEDVYAYLFAVPRTTKAEDADQYSGIYNICGKYDPVTQIPTEAWGFYRYGTDLYTPAMEMDSQYLELALAANAVNREMLKEDFWYNPVANYQLHLILEFLSELFPTNGDYAEMLQESLMEAWSEAKPETFAQVLVVAIEQMEDLDQRQEYSSEVFVDYMSYLASDLLKEKSDRVDDGFWNPKQGIVDNLMREHMPYTYINWLFADLPEEEILHGPDIARRVYIFGNVDVEILSDGTMIQGIDRKGNAYEPEQVDEEFLFRSVLLLRNGNETLTSLPDDGTFQIRIKADQDEFITMYDIVSMPYTTFGIMDDLDFFQLSKGEYLVDFPVSEDEYVFETLEGEVVDRVSVPYEYSPTMVMAGESEAVKHLTVPGVVSLVVGVILLVVVLLLVCLIIAIVHKIRKKKRQKPYSPWFVIVPHLIMIILFTMLTRFFTVNMYSLSMTRIICAFVTMATICLLSLRGLLRKRCKRNVVITLALVAVSVVNLLLYQRSSGVSTAALTFVLYGLCIAGLTALAVCTFFDWKQRNSSAGQDSLTGSAQG